MAQRVTPESILYAGHNVGFDQEGKPVIAAIRCVAVHALPQKREYSQAELTEAFKSVASKAHWKNKIDAVIQSVDKEVVDAAIAHFAYGFAEFTDLGDGRVRVTAPGYWEAEDLLTRDRGEEQGKS